MVNAAREQIARNAARGFGDLIFGCAVAAFVAVLAGELTKPHFVAIAWKFVKTDRASEVVHDRLCSVCYW